MPKDMNGVTFRIEIMGDSIQDFFWHFSQYHNFVRTRGACRIGIKRQKYKKTMTFSNEFLMYQEKSYVRSGMKVWKTSLGNALRYSTWIGRGFFKILQISLVGVSINIIGHVFFVFAQKKICVDLWRFDFFVPNRGFTLENPNWPLFYVFVARFLRS
jgi:hypothetical protein